MIFDFLFGYCFPVWILDLWMLFYMFVCVADVFDDLLVFFALAFLDFFYRWGFGFVGFV